MKVYVYKDELYPFYGIDTTRELVDIPIRLYKKYEKMVKLFKEVMEELKEYSCEG